MKRVLSLILSVLMVVSAFTFGAINVSAADAKLIEKASDWYYWTNADISAELPEGWYEPDFDATAWGETSVAPFGNFYCGVKNTDVGDAQITLMVRDFTIADLSSVATLTMEILYDQDPVVYINGEKVFETTGYNTDYAPVNLSDYISVLKEGTNRIAVYTDNTNDVDGGKNNGGYGYGVAIDLALTAGGPVDDNGYARIASASKKGFYDWGSGNAAENILDGNVGSCSGSGRNKDVEQSWTVTFFDYIEVSEIYLQTKGVEDGVATSHEDGITFGHYNVYVGETLVGENVPAISEVDGGYTLTLDEPAVGVSVKVELTGEWYSTNWANLADIAIKGAVSDAEVKAHVLTNEAFFVSGLGEEYGFLNDGVASNAGYADLGAWADTVESPAYGITNGVCYIEVDLRTMCNIETIWAANYIIASRIYKWDAYVTDDNTKPISEWTYVGGKTTDEGSTEEGYTVTLEEAVEGRYVRLYGMYNSDNTGFHFTEITVTGTYVDPSKPLADKVAASYDFTISPYGGSYKGFENWDGGNGLQTQMLVCYSGLPEGETYANNTWRFTIAGTNGTKVVEAKPATSYDNWLHRFELAAIEGENQFIPQNGAVYSITAEVLGDSGEVLHTSRTYNAFKCLCDPIVPDVSFEGIQLGTDGSSIRFIGSINGTDYESVDLKITVKETGKTYSLATNKVFKNLNSVDGVVATVNKNATGDVHVIDADYLFGYAITGIPAGTYTFTIVPTAITADGSTVVGSTATIAVIVGSEYDDLANEATITESHPRYPDQSTAKYNDGLKDDYIQMQFAKDENDNVIPAYITVDFGKLCYVNNVTVYTYAADYTFELYGTTDGETWEFIGDNVDLKASYDGNKGFDIAVSGEYSQIQLKCLNGLWDFFSTYEIDVFGRQVAAN